VIGYIEDFVELVKLEARGVKRGAARAAVMAAVAAGSALLAVFALEVAALGGLIAAGWPLWLAALALAAVQLALACGVFWGAASIFRRQIRFDATREECVRTYLWIKQLLGSK
jgi:hypothetical protein